MHRAVISTNVGRASTQDHGRPLSALCMCRLLFARQLSSGFWKSRICIRPVYRLAGRGHFGVTLAPWSHYRKGHFLAERAVRLWGRFSPFQTSSSQRTPLGATVRSLSPHLLFHRTASRAAGRSRASARACWPAPPRACFCAFVLPHSPTIGRS